jgi:uncharacterized protein Yka (UPF0111/DUF47 family)
MSETLDVRVALVERAVAELPKLIESLRGDLRDGFGRTAEQIGRLDARLDRSEDRLDGLDAHLSGRLDRLEDRQRSDFHWLLGLILGVYGTGAVAFCGVFWLLARIKGWV